jgi:hypothetical protein
MELVYGSIVLSICALIVGLLLGPRDLTNNILANLVLLGPGLIITNIIVRNWRLRRRSQELHPLLAAVYNNLMVVARDCYRLMEVLDIPVLDDPPSSQPGDLSELKAFLSSLSERVRSLRDTDYRVNTRPLKVTLEYFDPTELQRLAALLQSIAPSPLLPLAVEHLIWVSHGHIRTTRDPAAPRASGIAMMGGTGPLGPWISKGDMMASVRDIAQYIFNVCEASCKVIAAIQQTR